MPALRARSTCSRGCRCLSVRSFFMRLSTPITLEVACSAAAQLKRTWIPNRLPDDDRVLLKSLFERRKVPQSTCFQFIRNCLASGRNQICIHRETCKVIIHQVPVVLPKLETLGRTLWFGVHMTVFSLHRGWVSFSGTRLCGSRSQ